MESAYSPADKANTHLKISTAIAGWRHLYNLACMEGVLMAIAARQYLSGHLNESDRNQIAYIAFEFVQRRYIDREVLSSSCAQLASEIEQLAMRIDRPGWSWALSLEAGAEDKCSARLIEGGQGEGGAEIILENCINYKNLNLHAETFFASVFVPVSFTVNSNFEVVDLQSSRQLAITAGIKLARQIGCYCASAEGGYGDVIIRETTAPPTYTDFQSWFPS